MMPKGMQGPFTLTAETVKTAVTGTLYGVYALGHTEENGTFIIESVGRFNGNVKEQLQNLAVGCHGEFLFQYYVSAKGAFEKECEIYHEFLTTTDTVHPDRPDGSYWKCPKCCALD